MSWAALERIRNDAIDAYLHALWLHVQEAFEGNWDAADLGRAVLSDMLERGVIQRGSELTAETAGRLLKEEA